MFKLLGQGIARRAVWLVLFWVVAIAAAAIWATRTTATAPAESGSVLPPDHPWTQAMLRMRTAFPLLNARSNIVVIGYRPGGLTSGDLAWLGRVGERVESSLKFKTLSPTTPFLPGQSHLNPLAEHLEQVIQIHGRPESFPPGSDLARFLPAEKVQRQPSDAGQVFG